MAHKKKNGKGGRPQKPMSADKYIKENARKLDIGLCYANPDWPMCGMAMVIVTRLHKNGNITAGFYKIDTFCLGVKDSFYILNASEEELDDKLSLIEENFNIEEITYDEAHNLIYEALEFAAEAGIKPCEEWAVTRYILNDDNDGSVPLIEYEMGRNGKHFLVAKDNMELSKYLPTLKANLGDGVEYSFISDLFDDPSPVGFNDNLETAATTNGGQISVGQYSHNTAVIMAGKPTLHDSGLWQLLGCSKLGKAELGKILAMPPQQLKDDLGRVLVYSMDKHCGSDPNMDFPTVFNAVRLIGEVGDGHSLGILLETLRQDVSYHDSFFVFDLLSCYTPALAKLACSHADLLGELLCEPGITAIGRSVAMAALSHLYYTRPAMQAEIIDLWRKVLQTYIESQPSPDVCDSFTAAYAIKSLVLIKGRELLPLIKRLMEVCPVPLFICDDYDVVADDIDNLEFEYDPSLYPEDIYEYYNTLCI